jgi:SAM-dependent methyltransferase
MIKLKIGNPKEKNKELIELIKNVQINQFYLNNQKDFRDLILSNIQKSDSVLDLGKGMREKFNMIDCSKLETLDVNEYDDYPDIICDLCDEINDDLKNRYDKIICLAVLEHVYNPFKAIENITKLLKDGGKVYGMVPYLYHYHAPNDLKFQDYFRFSKDALSYLFKDFKEVELYPIRGKLSTSLNILLEGKWKKYIEKTKINIFFNKFFNKNLDQCSGYNFILKK